MQPDGRIIDLVGSGNVATHLAERFVQRGGNIRFLAARSPEKANALASAVGAKIKTLEELATVSDAVPLVLAISDDQIARVSELFRERFTVHTSGSVPMEAIASNQRGVLYPLQSFTKGRAVDWTDVPLCIEAPTDALLTVLTQVAATLGERVAVISSSDRRKLHLAAVVVNNFVNHLFRESENYLSNNGLSLDILHPLMRETVAKAVDLGPQAAQTGPARRNDQRTISAHLEALSQEPELQDLYRRISDAITRSYHG